MRSHVVSRLAYTLFGDAQRLMEGILEGFQVLQLGIWFPLGNFKGRNHGGHAILDAQNTRPLPQCVSGCFQIQIMTKGKPKHANGAL